MVWVGIYGYDHGLMVTVRTLVDALDSAIPASKSADWDVSGLQLGDPDAEVSSVAVCHEVTEEIVQTLESSPVQLLVTYHPLLFRPTATIVAGSGPGGRAYRLLRAGVAVSVAHTSFDVASGGTADALAEAIGMVDATGFGIGDPKSQIKLVTFVPTDSVEAVGTALSAAGAGVVGDYSGCSFRVEGTGTFNPGETSSPVSGVRGRSNHEREIRIEMVAPESGRERLVSALVATHPYEEPAFDIYPVVSNTGFIGRVGTTVSATFEDLVSVVAGSLGRAGLRASGAPSATIDRVAVVPGSGSDFIAAAFAVGASVLVTGDVSHHQLIGALDRGLMIIDAGHAATERPGMRALVGRVRSAVGGVAPVTDLTDADPTPWR